MNKAIKNNLKIKLENLKRRWTNDLSEVLRAYRTTAKSMTKQTPFLLAYGYEYIVPVELGARSLRRGNFDLEQNMILNDASLIFSKKNDVTHNFGSRHTNGTLLGT